MAQRILFIGNSYTHCNELPRQLENLYRSAGAELSTQMITAGGASLQQHWNGKLARPLLKKGAWDFVVLQEQTRKPFESTAKYHDAVRKFDEEIRACSAKTVLYLTWAPGDEPERQSQLNEAISTIAREVKALVAPSGPAFEIIRKEAPKIRLYVEDNRHPSPAGTYLSACAFYGALTGRSPVGLAAKVFEGREPKAKELELSKANAAVLQKAAWRAVKESPFL